MNPESGQTAVLPSAPRQPLAADGGTRQLAGRATLRFLGLAIYDATLHVAEDFRAADYDQHPVRLELSYARKLEGKLIAERSLIEMQRLATISPEEAGRWMALMEKAFPDVSAGDKLSGEHDGKGSVRFFHNGKLRAQTVDRRFASLFFGIWLHAGTSEPALRRGLLGGYLP